MIYLSYGRFLLWFPFLLLGFAVSILLRFYFDIRRKRFEIPARTHSSIVLVLAPSNLFTMVSLDLFFMFRGDSLLVYTGGVVGYMLPAYLVLFSFIVGMQTSVAVLTSHLLGQKKRVRLSITMILLSSLLLVLFGLAYVLAGFRVYYIAPLFSMSTGLMAGVSLQMKRHGPLGYFIFPLGTTVFFLLYLFIIIFTFV